ncbi:hypothetical protein F3K37_42050 [Streptomyces sp. LBUM 1477]|nr:hypothetical protein [Streptomyces sp. LBUM 1477]
MPTQPGPVQLQKPPADSPADAWNTTVAPAALDPDPAPAAPDPGDGAPSVPATSPANPAPADDDQAVGLREAHERHLPDITVAALRYARANDRTFPKPVGKRGAELLYRVGDLKRWARNRPRAAIGTTDLD